MLWLYKLNVSKIDIFLKIMLRFYFKCGIFSGCFFLALPLPFGNMQSSTSLYLHWLFPSLQKKVGQISQFWWYDYEIWHEASLDTIIRIKEVKIRKTMWGPCLGHKRARFWQFKQQKDAAEQASCPSGLPPSTLTSHPCNHLMHPLTQYWVFRKYKLGGPYENHVWAIKGQNFGNLKHAWSLKSH